MKNSGFLACCLPGLMLAGCGQTEPEANAVALEAPAANPTLRPVDPGAIAAFKAAIKREPKVIDFVYDPQAIYQWTIGVKDDGSGRSGYASYFCVLMEESGMRRDNAKVRIVDFQRYQQLHGDAREASLGSADCATGDQADI